MQIDSIAPGPSALTAKQREAVELLAQHKTSKEISRILGISPHTVDQRIESAKKKFGVSTRGELARAYLASKSIGQRLTYEESHMSDPFMFAKESAAEEPSLSLPAEGQEPSNLVETGTPVKRYQVLPELFSGSAGTIYRIVTIAILATLMILVFAGGISIFVALTEVLDR